MQLQKKIMHEKNFKKVKLVDIKPLP